MKKPWTQQFKRSPKEARTSRDGILFDSKGELQYWEKLKLWQLAGEIKNLRRQVVFPLVKDSIEVLTETGRVAHYTADFVWVDKDGKIVVADFKQYKSREAMFRIRVFEALYGVKVKIVGMK